MHRLEWVRSLTIGQMFGEVPFLIHITAYELRMSECLCCPAARIWLCPLSGTYMLELSHSPVGLLQGCNRHEVAAAGMAGMPVGPCKEPLQPDQHCLHFSVRHTAAAEPLRGSCWWLACCWIASVSYFSPNLGVLDLVGCLIP